MINYVKIIKKDGDMPWEGSLADFEKKFFAFRNRRDDEYVQRNIIEYVVSMGWRELHLNFDYYQYT